MEIERQNRGFKFYGGMFMHNNAVITTIDTANINHLVLNFSTGLLNGFTFNAGSTAAITVFADAGGGQVTVISNAHGLSTGGIVSITGTTNYNGVFVIANALTNTFEITDTWVADDGTGTWNNGSNLVAGVGVGGIYEVQYNMSGFVAVANKDLEWHIYQNENEIEQSHSTRRFAAIDKGVTAGGGLIQIADGDIISLAVLNLTDTINFTHTSVSVRIFG